MGARFGNRHIVEKEVPCTIAGVPGLAFLYNLSTGGCMLESSAAVAVGDAVSVALEGFETATGKVAWQAGQCVGVSFALPVHEAIVRHIGFTPQATAFEEQAPRDRFGRALPAMDAGEPRRMSR